VRHDHRCELWPFLSRRAFYAKSEALLLERHPNNGRFLVVPLSFVASFGWALIAFLLGLPALASLAVLPAVAEIILLWRWIHNEQLPIPVRVMFRVILSKYGSFLYFGATHIARYYTIPVIVISLLVGLFWPPIRWLVLLVMLSLVGPALIDWWRLRPRLSLLRFVAGYVLDNLAYHLGVLAACLHHRTFRPLRLKLIGSR
jgi:hypothetical protein